MPAISPQDLSTLSEQDQSLLFNYFGALGGVAHSRKMAATTALIGCILVASVYLIDAAVADQPPGPEWLSSMSWFMKIVPVVYAVLGVSVYLWRAWSCNRKVDALALDLSLRQLDVSGLTQEQVFEHVARPLLRRAGIRIKE